MTYSRYFGPAAAPDAPTSRPARRRPAAPRGLTPRDTQEWAGYARQVAPLQGRAVPVAAEPTPDAAVVPRSPTPPAAPPIQARAPSRPSVLVVGSHPGGLDSGTWNRLRGGKLAPARRLDLHGRTAQRAFHALHDFLLSAHADRLRCVEVITGRGSGEAGGVIRRELPVWINLPALRPLILAAAHPHAANPGSTLLLLRARRA